MMKCPKCGSDDMIRSRSKNRWEVWRKEITRKRPYRCRKCAWRGWRPEVAPIFAEEHVRAAERALAPDPPNLAGTPLARHDALKPGQVQIDKLDAFDADEKS